MTKTRALRAAMWCAAVVLAGCAEQPHSASLPTRPAGEQGGVRPVDHRRYGGAYFSYPNGAAPTGAEVVGPIRQGGLDVTLPLSTIVGATPFAIGAGTVPVPAATALTRAGIVPDDYKSSADGVDDAPSIQRAVNVACGGLIRTIRFLGRHYTLNSPIVQSCFANWIGEAWEEQPSGGVSQALGTWFDIGTAFLANGLVPIHFHGGTGSIVANLAFDEPGMTAAPTPIINGSGQTTGFSSTSWAPASYPQVMQADGVPGMTFQHIMLDGVNAGIVANSSGRTDFFDIRGQAFAYLLNVQTAYDVSHIVYVHNWPYWSSSDPVMAFEQANESAIISYRNDTPFWDRVFVFGAKAGIEFADEPAGYTTGAAVGTISCDFTRSCLLIDNGVDATAQLGNIRSYGQVWSSVYGTPVTMIPGSSVIEYDGYAVLQIGEFEDYGTDAAMLNIVGSNGQTNTQIGSIYGVLTRMSPNSSIVKFSTTATNNSVVNVSMQPALTPDAPAGFHNTNASPNGTGNGQLFFPAQTPEP